MKYMNSPLLLDTYLQIMQELVEIMYDLNFVKLRQGSGKDRQGMALKAKGVKA